MSGARDDLAAELASQFEAAGALIESLEEEVASLRQNLEQANVALKAARKEVAAREEALEARDRARSEAEALAQSLREELARLGAGGPGRRQASGTDQHTAGVSDALQRELGAAEERHGVEISRLRQRYERSLAAERRRRRTETLALEERLEGMQTRRRSEAGIYKERLNELETERVEHQRAAEKEFERRLAEFTDETWRLKRRVMELEEALEEPRSARPRDEQFDKAPAPPAADAASDGGRSPNDDRLRDGQEPEERIRELEARDILAQERIENLESRLEKAHTEREKTATELREASARLQRLTEPEQRLRAGLALFNASEHARAIASISKALGPPGVHAGLDDGSPGRPVLSFTWGEIAWRRYISDPTEGIGEPRVYLIGTGGDPSEMGPIPPPNARADSRGRLSLGLRAR